MSYCKCFSYWIWLKVPPFRHSALRPWIKISLFRIHLLMVWHECFILNADTSSWDKVYLCIHENVISETNDFSLNTSKDKLFGIEIHMICIEVYRFCNWNRIWMNEARAIDTSMSELYSNQIYIQKHKYIHENRT